MKLKPNQYHYVEWIDSICIDSIYESKIDSRENVRVITFPSRINKKPVTDIHILFFHSNFPSLQRVIVPKTLEACYGPSFYYYDKKPVIEYCDD